MPDVSLNGIEFEIKGGTEKASASIDDLVAILDKLSTALESVVNKSGLTGVGNKAKKEVEPLDEALQDLIRNADKVEVLRGKLDGLRDSLEDAFEAGNEKRAWGIQGQILSTEAALEKATVSVKPLSAEMQDMIANASQIDILEAKLESLRSSMQQAFDVGDQEGAYKFREQILRTEAALEKARAAADKTADSLEDVGDSAKKANKPLSNFVSSLKRIAFYRIIRGIIKGITQAFQEGLKNAYEFSKATGDQSGLAASLDKLATSGMQMKNQLGAAFGGLIQAVMPIVLDLIALVTKLASALSALFGMFNGSGGYLQAKEFWTEWGDAAGGAGGAAKKALEYLAPFDELNVLPDPSSGGGGGGTDYGSMFEWVPFEEGSLGQKISDYVQENLEAIEAISHLFEFAIGLIMVLSNPASLIGWGLMAYGAYKLWQDGTANWDAISEQLQGTLGTVTAVVSVFLLVIGILLCVAQVWPLGLGLIAAGAVGLAATVAANWDAIEEKLEDPMSAAHILVSNYKLVLGILLCVAGQWNLGLGLIKEGASGLGSTAAAEWDSLKEFGKKACDKVKEGWDSVSNAFEVGVELVKSGWKTVSGWIKEGGWGYAVKKGIGVMRDGWKNISTWIKDSWMGKAVYKGIKVSRDGWKTLFSWIKEKWMGADLYKKVKVSRDGWKTITGWITAKWLGSDLYKKIKVSRDTGQWKNIADWIKGKWMGSDLYKKINLSRNDWETVKSWIENSWMGDEISKGVKLVRAGTFELYENVKGWIEKFYMGSDLEKAVKLVRSSLWKNVHDWIVDNKWVGDAVDVLVNLKQNGWDSVKSWLSKLLGGALNLTVTQSGSNSYRGNDYGIRAATANQIINSFSASLYPSSGFVAVASVGNSDGNVTEEMLYRAFSRALADSDLGGDVNLDGNALYRAMVTRNRQNTRLTGVNAFA